MSRRCPRAKPVGPARLANHRFFIMADGVASVRPEAGATVHGLLWNLTLSDVAPLDVFEDVALGQYIKLIKPVLRPVGSTRAFLYVGHTHAEGRPRPGYLEAVVAAAAELGLPAPYLRAVQAWGKHGTRGAMFDNQTSDAPSGPVAGVRPRFATPHDRT